MQTTVIVPGNLDGVHLGHQALIKRACEISRKQDVQAAALFFDPHPVELFKPELKVEKITLVDRRKALLRQAGVSTVFVEKFDTAFSNLSPEDFVSEILMKKYACGALVVGPDFRFGKKRAGDVSVLKALGGSYGIEIHVFNEPVLIGGAVVSSSRIRAAISDGRVDEASQLLGRFHEIQGEVIHGDARARTLGFPTANLQCESVILPADGVYAVWVEILSDKNASPTRIAGVANLGVRPTFDAGRSVEVHLLDFNEDLYGQYLRVHFVTRLRSEKKFESVEALKKQIQKDCKSARDFLVDLRAR